MHQSDKRKKPEKKEMRSEEESDAEAGRKEKKAAFAMRQALNFPQVKQKLSWVGAQTERREGPRYRGGTGGGQTARQNHEVAPLKHASLAHCDNENDTHTHIYTHSYIYITPTHTATVPPSPLPAYTWGIKAISWHTSGRWDETRELGTATDVNVRNSTHIRTHTSHTHTYRHMWVLKKYVYKKKET